MKRQIDVEALYSALESKKSDQDRSWRDIARELEIDHTTFTRMSKGQTPDAATVVTLTGWLGVPLERFVSGEPMEADSREETLAAIRTYLRADRALKPESSQAIESVLRAAYDQLAEKVPQGEQAEPERAPAKAS